jgi:hypothetical protein
LVVAHPAMTEKRKRKAHRVGKGCFIAYSFIRLKK